MAKYSVYWCEYYRLFLQGYTKYRKKLQKEMLQLKLPSPKLLQGECKKRTVSKLERKLVNLTPAVMKVANI